MNLNMVLPIIGNNYEHMIGILVVWILGFVVYNITSRKKNKRDEGGSNSEASTEYLNWNPKPLVPETDDEMEEYAKSTPIVVNGKVGKYVNIEGKDLLNFSSHNYLGLVENKRIIDEAEKCIYKYGVGSCGPRGFYGTMDVHIKLEADLANFLKTENCIVYSYGFSTIASAIPAYAKKGDVIFVDERVNFAIQRGLDASRSKIFFFKHNDMNDLEQLIQTFPNDFSKKKRKDIRKFLIVEGIYINTGLICPLPKLLELKDKYKIRLFIDESISLGVLGKTGRGVVEHFNENVDNVDMIMGSMENALGTGGGFCVGSAYIIEHQRLSGQGYCFSASLPPFLAVAASTGIEIIKEDDSKIIKRLQDRCLTLSRMLKETELIKKYFITQGNELSPIKHLILREQFRNSDSPKKNWDFLNKISEYCRDNGVIITAANYLVTKEHFKPPPSIRLTVMVLMDNDDIKKLINALENSLSRINSS